MNMRLQRANLGPVLLLVSLLSAGANDAISQQVSDSIPQASADQRVLQVGAFSEPANAYRLVEDLRQKGFAAFTQSTGVDAGSGLTLVLTGPYAVESDALAAKASLETDGITAILRKRQVQVVRAEPAPTPVQDSRTSNMSKSGARVPPESADLAQDSAQLFAQVERDIFEVPPVMERPLGMDEGPRVTVSRFELTGAVNRVKQDVTVSNLDALLSGHVRTQPAEGFTINQLQSVADDVTRYYRERGFIIAQAIVPVQEITDGVVSLRVLEGSLEDVRVEGNNVYKSDVVARPFQRLRGRPITQSSIERALLDVQDFPGLTVFGTFTQGDELGNTDLVVRVREEERFYITPTVDNYGSEFTGEFRGMLDFQFNNVFGTADQINGYVLQTVDPENGTYGGLSVEFPFGRNSISVGASTNQFDVDVDEVFEDLGVEGTVDQADIAWKYRIANGRYFSANGRFGIAIKNAQTKIPGAVLNEDNLAVSTLAFDFFSASRKGRGITLGSIQIDVGMPDTFGSMDGSGDGISSRQGGDGELAGGSFELARFTFQHLRRISTNHSVLLRLDGQWTDDILVALEQYAIGGPQNVRAYPVAESLVDTGGSASLEWTINAPGFADKPVGSRTWGEVFQLSFYGDYAYGETNNPLLSQEPTVDFSGYGMGLQFNVPGKLFARFDLASPIGSRDTSNDRDPQYYFRVSYTF